MQGTIPYLYDTFTSVSTKIPQNGTVNYAYTVDANIPASKATDRFKITFPSGTLTLDNRNVYSIELYPNPASEGKFYLSIPQNMEDLEVTIYNALGAKLYYQTGFTPGKNATIETNHIREHGVYFVKLTSEGKTTTKKLIIN